MATAVAPAAAAGAAKAAPAAKPAAPKPPAGGAPDVELSYTFNGSVELATADLATAVCSALEVDPELNPDLVHRALRTEGRTMHIEFAATELRLLRAAVSTFYDLLALAVRTAEQFGGDKFGGGGSGRGGEGEAAEQPAAAGAAAGADP